MILNLVPYPQNVEFLDGICLLKPYVMTSDKSSVCTVFLKEIGSKGDIAVEFLPINQWPGEISDKIIDTEEGYILAVKENSIAIYGKTDKGYFNGAMTLKQLIKQFGQKLPCLIIYDYPILAYRGVQLSYAQVNVEYRQKWIERFIREMAYIKTTHIHLYFEWNFAFPSLPPVVSDRFLDPKRAKHIIEYAKKYNITIVPALNVLGHSLDFLSAQLFDELKEYDEEKHSTKTKQGQELCIKNPKTMMLVKGILNDICEIFNSEVIHVGGDEVENIGVCPLCKHELERYGRMGLYLQFFAELKDYLKQKGRKMGIWGDQLMNFSSDNRYWCKKEIEEKYLEQNQKQFQDLIENTVVFDWWYDGENRAGISFFTQNKFELIPSTSTHGCMTASLNLGQQMNQHALIKDAIKYKAKGILVTDWINTLGYHAEQMFFNYASGIALSWSGCDDSFIRDCSREKFEKAYAFIRYGTDKDALLQYIHYSGDSKSPLLSMFSPTQRGVQLRKQLFYNTNPLHFFIFINKEFDNEKIKAYEKQVAHLNELWEAVLRETPDDGYLYALKLPVVLHNALSKRLIETNKFYNLYVKAAKLQYVNKDEFVAVLQNCMDCLSSLLHDFDEPIAFAKYMHRCFGLEKGSVLRLQMTKKNVIKLIGFIKRLMDNHRPLPNMSNISEMLFGHGKSDWWVGRNNEWYDEKKPFTSVETDSGAGCMYIDF